MSKAIEAGRAFVKVFADNSKLIKGLALAKQRVAKFGKNISMVGAGMSAIGTAVLAPMGAMGKMFASAGDDIAKMSRRTGVAVGPLSELKYVAGQCGTDVKSLENGLRKMQRTVYDAGRGLSTAVDGLSDLGLTVKDFEGLSPEEQFKLMAEQISKIDDPSRQAAIAMTLLGRSGTMLLPMMQNGAEGIEQLQEKARKLGLTMSSKDALNAEVFTDAMDDLASTTKMAGFNIGASLAPILIKITDLITKVSSKISKLINQNRPLIVLIAKIAGVFAGAGLGLLAFGKVIGLCALQIGVLSKVFAGVGIAINAIIAVLGAIISPIGLVVAGVLALGFVFFKFTDIGQKSLAWLTDKFKLFADKVKYVFGDVGQAFGGIKDAIMAGDIELAFKILSTALNLIWLKTVNALYEPWTKFKNFMVKTYYDAVYGIVLVGQMAFGGLEAAWIEAVNGTAKALVKVMGWFSDEWAKMGDDLIIAIEQERQQERQQATDRNLNRIGKTLDTWQQKTDNVGADDKQNKRNLEQELAQAQMQLMQLTKNAKEAKIAKDNNEAKKSDGLSFTDLASLEGMEANVQKQVAKVSSVGMFNASAAFGLGSGSVQERTAKASERTADNTDKLLRQNSGVVFS